MTDNQSDQLPDDAITAALADAEVAVTMSGCIPAGIREPWFRIALAAAAPAIAARAAAAERERLIAPMDAEAFRDFAQWMENATGRELGWPRWLRKVADLLDGAQ